MSGPVRVLCSVAVVAVVLLGVLSARSGEGTDSSEKTKHAVEPTIRLVPIVTQWSDRGKHPGVAVEFSNRTGKPATFIVPQDGSLWGWLDPKYLFTVRTADGKVLQIGPRCGMFGGRYDEDAFFTVAPGKSGYVFVDVLPHRRISGGISVSLTYSVGETTEKARRWNKLDAPALKKWPANTFTGTLTSDTITFDPSKAKPIKRGDPGLAHLKGVPEPGKTESGLQLTLYPSVKLQTWETGRMRVQVMNRADELYKVTGDDWNFEIHWTDAKGAEVEHFACANVRWYNAHLPQRLAPKTGVTNAGLPIGFAKKPGKYRVYCVLTARGRGKVTSNAIDVEVVANELVGCSITPHKPRATTTERQKQGTALPLDIYGVGAALKSIGVRRNWKLIEHRLMAINRMTVEVASEKPGVDSLRLHFEQYGRNWRLVIPTQEEVDAWLLKSAPSESTPNKSTGGNSR